MAKNANEWFLQSDYDLATAGIMRKSGRNFYAVFMCHMAMINKKLSGRVPFGVGVAPGLPLVGRLCDWPAAALRLPHAKKDFFTEKCLKVRVTECPESARTAPTRHLECSL